MSRFKQVNLGGDSDDQYHGNRYQRDDGLSNQEIT